MPPYLSPECLHNILINLQYDCKTLHSCLFVNRDWCANVVPVLWKKPLNLAGLKSRLTMNDFSSGLIIRTYISCISLDSFPLFDYPSFLKELDFEELYDGISNFISTYSTENTGEKLTLPEDYQKISLIKKTLDLIFKRCYRLDYIYLDVGRLPPVFFNILNELCEQINPICLQNLDFLDYRGIDDSYACYEDFFDPLYTLSKVCKNITYMNIKLFGVPISDGIVLLIRAQRNLQKIFLWECNLRDMSKVMNSLGSQAKHLKKVGIYHCSFEYCEPLQGLAKCRNLTTLSIRQCDFVTSALLHPLALTRFSHIKKLELYYFNPSLTYMNSEDVPTEQVQEIIKNCNKNLEQLIVNLSHDQYFEIIESIATNCPSITTLELNLQNEEQIPKLLPILKACTKLTKLMIHPLEPSRFIRVSTSVIRWFISNLPLGISHLDLKRWSINPESLGILLNHGPDLKYLSWGFSDIDPTVVTVIGKGTLFSGIINDHIKKRSKEIRRFGIIDIYVHDGINDGSSFLEFL
ncbi:3650_t:CDS:1 [Acaulospora morrowiae]|uniref:3650_t:CDS:1 n=1 Tax=Acaulospora morrowiae TaxID=94023 RepID=A0A9N9DEQ1_9GLOM|nr:3650_t:CDS:1 [Acaulospora morrowiae]